MDGEQIIEHDLFGIAARLRSIDDGYFVVYNKRTHAFEVHNRRQRGSTFALSVPYPCLDVRTELLVRRTRVENARRLLEEMERDNRKNEARLQREQREEIAKKVEEAV